MLEAQSSSAPLFHRPPLERPPFEVLFLKTLPQKQTKLTAFFFLGLLSFGSSILSLSLSLAVRSSCPSLPLRAALFRG
jgi:hypothetical protein